jgi:hypothetical protein
MLNTITCWIQIRQKARIRTWIRFQINLNADNDPFVDKKKCEAPTNCRIQIHLIRIRIIMTKNFTILNFKNLSLLYTIKMFIFFFLGQFSRDGNHYDFLLEITKIWQVSRLLVRGFFS